MKERVNKSYLTSVVLPPEGNGLLERNETDKNTDVRFPLRNLASELPSF